MESSNSTTPYSSLSFGKTAHLGNGKPAPFPSKGMNHIYERESEEPIERIPLSLKRKKGKSVCIDHRTNDPQSYLDLADFNTPITFIPPTKLILSKAEILRRAKLLVKPESPKAFHRALHILQSQDRDREPESELWIHKFRPRLADEILSPQGLELRDWITGNRKIVSSTPPNDSDDFIVDDVSVSEDDMSPRKPCRKREYTSYSNVVILTGPHGVGKSAAVACVAEELGYQVFEISPGSRRGAKEVMEAIGEVGQSELVTKHQPFRSVRPVNSSLGGGISRQRKGLICLEEIDVLYEEDRGFWTCITSLIERSRQPIIMTCNGTSSSPATSCLEIQAR